MKNISTQPLKGFRDFLPDQALKRKWLKDRIIEVFESWGYDPIETPTLEPLSIFEGQIGDDEKLFYKFKDAGNRDVALRYDQSVPSARYVAENKDKLGMPFRRYQIQSVFRAEKPQKGRYREFIQCDADIFGVASILADAEVIAVGLDIYKKLGFKNVKVLINDRALLTGFPYEAIFAIDKLKKIGEKGVVEEMMSRGISDSDAKMYLDKIQNLIPNENINFILNYLSKQGFDKSWYEFDPTIARSFSYSSGPIWEIIVTDLDGGSVLGGERFDGLIESISGTKIEATGFGLGFDRTFEAADTLGLIPDLKTKSQVLVTIFSESLALDSIDISSKLRRLRLMVELYPNPKDKLSKQIKYALSKGIRWVVVFGADEASKNVITIKDLITGEKFESNIETSKSIFLK